MIAVFIIIYLAVLVFYIMTGWKIYTKAGQPGWACIVPIYNFLVLLKICGKPWWWLLIALFVPIVNLIVLYICIPIWLGKAFGKSGGFIAGLILLGCIFYPILAFGSSQYVLGGAEAGDAAAGDAGDAGATA